MTEPTAQKPTQNPGHFFCLGCLEHQPPEQSSADPRYCIPCYRVLSAEARTHPSTADWVPVSPKHTVQDIHIRAGDSIRFLGSGSDADATAESLWCVVDVVLGEDRGIILVHDPETGTKTVVNPGLIFEHYIPDDPLRVQPSAALNIKNCRSTLSRLPDTTHWKVVGFWKSKVAHAEHLCYQAAAQAHRKTRSTSKL